ncbi:hypothetical protein GWK47_049092 [Chionoecetes opilio]|uniref:Uncharacterized protein n=1 Tax=Chionoecetes opilio TaxID=41210 RepID=A0A8J4Y9L5_CHIOP|nr:hypothetical protein GWK47_049092 [Chionoecetes opilio]
MVRHWYKPLENQGGPKSFGDRADVFNASVFSNFNEHCSRVDVVFDRYGYHINQVWDPGKERGASTFYPAQDRQQRDSTPCQTGSSSWTTRKQANLTNISCSNSDVESIIAVHRRSATLPVAIFTTYPGYEKIKGEQARAVMMAEFCSIPTCGKQITSDRAEVHDKGLEGPLRASIEREDGLQSVFERKRSQLPVPVHGKCRREYIRPCIPESIGRLLSAFVSRWGRPVVLTSFFVRLKNCAAHACQNRVTVVSYSVGEAV